MSVTINHSFFRSDSFTPVDARCTRFYILMRILKDNFPDKKDCIREIIHKVRDTKSISQGYVNKYFTDQQINIIWGRTIDIMINSYNVQPCKDDDDDGSIRCSICMENIGDHVFVHGSTGHGSICGRCALRVSLDDKMECPMCKQKLTCVSKRNCIHKSIVVFD